MDAILIGKVREQITIIATLIKQGKICPHTETGKVAIFAARTLRGDQHVGWAFTDKATQAGDYFHYDHGVGVDQNRDGQYLWVAPLTRKEFERMCSEREFLSGECGGLATLKDGRRVWGRLSKDTTYRNRPPLITFYAEGVNLNNLSDILCLSPLPGEDHPVWKPCSSEFPSEGEMVVTWDDDKVRQNYRGPYFDVGKFSATADANHRYQGYSGPMVSSLPWTSQRSWQSLSTLFDVTLGDYFAALLEATDNG